MSRSQVAPFTVELNRRNLNFPILVIQGVHPGKTQTPNAEARGTNATLLRELQGLDESLPQ